MAYSRPTYRRRAPARKYQVAPTKSVYKKVMKPTRTALPALARQVATLSRQVKGTTSDVQYGASFNNPIGNIAGNNVFIYPLSQYSSWTRIFGTDADDESNHKALWKKSNYDFQINTNGERSLIDYSFYIVSLTKLGQEELFTPATGGLAGPLGITGLTAGTHYFQLYAGLTMLNRKYFNILQVKRLRTGSYGSFATDTNDLSKRWYTKMNYNQGKGHLLQNPKGDWKSIPSPQPAAQNMYILCFNNDSTADQSVNLQMTAIHSLQIA